MSSMSWPSLQYFSTYSHKRRDFRKKKLLNAICLLWFPLKLLFEISLIVRRPERDMIKIIHISLHFKYPLLSTDFTLNPNFLDKFSKNPQMWNLIKICTVGAELFRAERQTDGHDEACSRISQFCESTQKLLLREDKRIFRHSINVAPPPTT